MMLRLKQPLVAPIELVSKKVATAATFLSLMRDEGLFIPSSLSVWDGGFSEADGGKLVISRDDISNWGSAGLMNYLMEVVVGKLVAPNRVVIRVDGELKADSEKFPAYMAIYGSPSMARIYGDVEFDVWPVSGIESIADVYYEYEEFKRKYVGIIGRVLGEVSKSLKYVVVGESPDADWNVNEWAFFYSPEKKLIVLNIFKTVKYLAENGVEELKLLAKIIRPYKEAFFATTFFGIKEFIKKLLEIARASHVSLDLRKSVMFASETRESPRLFFENFKNELLLPLQDILVNEDQIKNALEKIVKKQRTLI